MKTITLITILFCSLNIFAQKKFSEYFEPSYGCSGCWEVDKVKESKWITVDTINYDAKQDTSWTLSEWIVNQDDVQTFCYCPCGCGNVTTRQMFRINEKGIRQVKFETTEYVFITIQESDYDKKLNKIKNKKVKK